MPNWISYGYTTLCSEIPFDPAVLLVPCGADSFAQGVITYYRSHKSNTKVFSVEPDTAYTVNKSLVLQKASSDLGTSRTIMDELNCPRISATAFLLLQKGAIYFLFSFR